MELGKTDHENLHLKLGTQADRHGMRQALLLTRRSRFDTSETPLPKLYAPPASLSVN